MNIKKLLIFILSLQLSGCAFAPFSTTNTARSNGAGVQSLQAGLVEGRIPYFHYDYGLSSNIDIGAESEFGLGAYMLGFSTKLSFINDGQGLASALMAGFGKDLTGDSRYWYLGPIVSHKFTYFEPAIALRYTDTSSDEIDVNTASGGITFSGTHLRYWYLVLSGTLYPADWFGIVFQLSDALNTKGNSGEDVTDGFIMSLGIKYKF